MKLMLIPSLLFLLALESSMAQTTDAPVITGFSPVKGSIGTSVAVSGANFSTNAADNIVYFGASRATVTNASATELEVIVPVGATYRPISAAVGGLIAYSSKPFTVTFPGNPITTGSFSHKMNFTSGLEYTRDGAIGDIDGDGKPDIVIADYTDIAVFRNTTSTGMITTGSFAPKINVDADGTPLRIMRIELEDIDADGKLDLLVVSFDNNMIYIFRNVSTSGAITATSFGTRVDIPAGDSPASFAVSDMDGDGKPDLVVGNYHNTDVVSIIRNTSVGGIITFDTPVFFATGGNSYDVVARDLDNDNKPDIIFPTASFKRSISIFRNTGAPGVIDENSLAAGLDFATGQFPFTIGLGDLDGDGKTDITAGTSNTTNVRLISILRNTGTPGALSTASFAPKVDLTVAADPYSLALSDLDGDGKPDIAIKGCGSSHCFISVFRNVSDPGTLTSTSFESRMDFVVGSGADFVEAADLDGDGMPELVSSVDQSLVILQNAITASPEITTFNPVSGPVGTEITISGSNFSTTPSNNIVGFNGVEAQVLISSPTSLTVIIPSGATTGIISVTVNGQSGTSATPFTVTKESQTITFNSLATQAFENPDFSLTATASSALPVSFTSSNHSVATMAGNMVSIKGAGTTTITALQAGNDIYNPALPVQHVLTVNKAPQTIVFGALPGKSVGDPAFTLGAVASSGLPLSYSSSDPDVAIVNGNSVTIVGVGTSKITASQSGNNNYQAASPVFQLLTVGESGRASQQILFGPLPMKAFKDNPFIVNATATSGLTVIFRSSNTSVATVSGKTVTVKAPGVTVITASQLGNTTYNPANPVEQTLIVEKASQQISFGGFAQSLHFDSNPIILGAASNSGLPVTFSSSNTSVAEMDFNTLTITGPGWVRITAMQSGNSFYNEAAPVYRDLYVYKTLQTITFDELAPGFLQDGPLELAAVASSGLAVRFSSNNSLVAIVNGNLVEIRGTGTAIITATQSGDEIYEPAAPVSRTLVVELVTSVEESFASKEVSIFPNPVASSATLRLSGFDSNETVALTVYDPYGRIVMDLKEEMKNDLSIDFSPLDIGIYSVAVRQGKKVRWQRFVKE